MQYLLKCGKTLGTKRGKIKERKSRRKCNNSTKLVDESDWGPATMAEDDWVEPSEQWNQTGELNLADQLDQGDQWGQANQWGQADQWGQGDQWGQEGDQWGQDGDQWESTAHLPNINPLSLDEKFGKWAKVSSPNEAPYDFIISHSNSVVFTYPQSGRIGITQLSNKNFRLEKIEYYSHNSILQPKGICILNNFSISVAIADGESCKVNALKITDLIAYTTGAGSGEWTYEFSLCLATTDSPILLCAKNDTREFLILTKSNAILTASYEGSIIRKLHFNELTSPYDMQHVSNGNIIVITDIESLVVLDCNGHSVAKYFHERLSRGGCILDSGEESVTLLSPASWDKTHSVQSVKYLF